MRCCAPLTIALAVLLVLCACGPRQPARAPGGSGTILDFLQAYNAYALAQTYLKRGRHAEAIVEYEESLRRYDRLGDAARTALREEYGLAREQIERELAIARALAREHAAAGPNPEELEHFRERVLAEFYPYGRGTPPHRTIRPGMQISRGTWQAAQELLPPEILQALIAGDFTIVVQDTTDLPPSEEYIVATLGYGTDVQLSDDGGTVSGYIAGRPFPVLEGTDPHAGRKAAWNLRYRDAGDRIEQWSDTVSRDRHSHLQYAFSSYYARAFGMYRAKKQHNLPAWEQHGIVYKEFSQIFVSPVADPLAAGRSRAGDSLVVLRHRYNSEHRPLGQWVIDSGSRKAKTLGYNPEGSTLGFTMILEDVAGEHISAHEWRLVQRTLALVPGLVRNYEALFGGTGGGYPLDPWELRHVYVVEMAPRSPHHPYSRKVLYLDRQTFAPFYVIIFDADHAHWRTIFFSYGNPEFSPENRDTRVPILLGQSWIDHRAQRTTIMQVTKALYNQPLSPDLFTFSTLMQHGK